MALGCHTCLLVYLDDLSFLLQDTAGQINKGEAKLADRYHFLDLHQMSGRQRQFDAAYPPLPHRYSLEWCLRLIAPTIGTDYHSTALLSVILLFTSFGLLLLP